MKTLPVRDYTGEMRKRTNQSNNPMEDKTMTKLSEQDLQNVSGGVLNMRRNEGNSSGPAVPRKPQEEADDKEV